MDDLFLDSGLIYGCIDVKDPFSDASTKFFNEHPFGRNNYYTVMRLMKREMETVRKRKEKEGNIKTKKALHQIIQKWNGILYSIPPLIKDVDYMKPDDVLCIQLYRRLLNILNRRDGKRKDRDADYLTNAFLWDNKITTLNNQHFITVDGGDIAGNSGELTNEAENCIGTAPRLRFCLIRK